ncbi:MAG: SDR family oxidoreductase [Anaerolineales bacterium]
MMRLLVTGVSGLFGLNLALQAQERFTVIGVARTPLQGVAFESHSSDLEAEDAALRLVADFRPDAVINGAALAYPDQCEAEPERAYRLNALFPSELARQCARARIPLIHISTDSVFDGRKTTPYTEEDSPNPLNTYARTKREAEEAVLEAHPQALVVRTNFYGWSPSGKRSLAEFFFSNLSAGKAVNGFTDVIFCPILVTDLAQLLLEMLERGLSGLYHVLGTQPMSKYAFGVAIARTFGLDENLIRPCSIADAPLAARRATHLWLSTQKVTEALGHPLPEFPTGLQQFYTQFLEGYPQKLRSYPQWTVEREREA